MEKLTQDYTAACPGTAIDYTTSGSGVGMKAFFGSAVGLAGSGSPLSHKGRDGVIEADRAEKRCRGNTALNSPMVPGPIAVAHGAKGVPDLNPTAELIARALTGDITRQDDPAIAAASPGASLPNARVAMLHRADESGTTENFTKYLAKTAGDTRGHDASKKWLIPRDEDKEKTTGVTDTATGIRNSTAYLGWGTTLKHDLKLTRIGGVELPGEAAGRVAATAGVETNGDDVRLDIDYTPSDGVYPLVMTTYKVVCSAGGSNLELLRDFLGLFTSETAQAFLKKLGYASLPGELRREVSRSVSGVR